MGVFIRGLFLQYDAYERIEDGKKRYVYSVVVACGRYAYSVYMDDDCSDDDLVGLEVGEPIQLECRPYVNKNGRLSWGGGTKIQRI